MSDCPAWHFFDTGDEGEAEHCSLPIEHNADDEPWHESTWQEDGMAATYRWRWDQDTLWMGWKWDPVTKVSIWIEYPTIWIEYPTIWIEYPTIWFRAGYTPTTVPNTGTTISFRKWGNLGKL